MGCGTNSIPKPGIFLLGCLLPDVDRVWEKVGFVELESGGPLVAEHLPLPNLLLPLLISNGGGSLGELCCLNARGDNDQATFSQPFPKRTTTQWPGLGSCLCET